MTSAAPDGGETGPGAPPRMALGTGRSLVAVPQAATGKRFFGFKGLTGLGRSHGYVAAGAAVLMGVSFVAGTALLAGHEKPAALAPRADTTMDVLVRVQGEVRALKASLDGLRSTAENGRQEETIRGLKRSVDTLKGDLESVKAASNAAVGQIGAKLDRLDRDPGPKLAEIASRLDKLDRDPGPKLAEMTARLDRVERQVSSADTTGSLPSPGAGTQAMAPKAPMPPQRIALPSPTGPSATLPPTRPDTVAKVEPAKADPTKAESPKAEPAKAEAAARPGTVEGWMLRDVYGGVALLEGRAGGLREVMPGEYIPGVGEIRSIERRGRGWVVVTSRGIIQADNRW